MKDFLSKEYYCCKIDTLLMKGSAYHSFYIQLPYMGYPPFFQENLDLWFFKNPNPPINNRGSHYEYNIMILWNSPDGEMDEGYIWSTIQTNSKMQVTGKILSSN